MVNGWQKRSRWWKCQKETGIDLLALIFNCVLIRGQTHHFPYESRFLSEGPLIAMRPNPHYIITSKIACCVVPILGPS